jgi:hypothetical protein
MRLQLLLQLCVLTQDVPLLYLNWIDLWQCSMAAAGVQNRGEGCSNVAAESSPRKTPRGRPVKVGHFHDDVGPSHFANAAMSHGLELLPIPEGDHYAEDQHQLLMDDQGERS